jgi:hypothetical protein
MPYEMREGPKGQWRVFTKGTSRSHSDKPLPRARALAQMRALYANMKPGER